MDIKDFILIGGGILIVMVVAHGFYIAWRAKREPYRLDIAPDLIPDDVDDMERLRGELPNGGARVVNSQRARRTAEPMTVGEPMLRGEAGGNTSGERNREVRREQQSELPLEHAQTSLALDNAPTLMQPAVEQQAQGHPTRTGAQSRKPKVHQAPPKPARGSELVTEPRDRPRVSDVQLVPEAVSNTQRSKPSRSDTDTQTASDAKVEELLIVNLLAPKGRRFEGEALVNALRAQGLRYGEMNIFHMIDPATKAKQFSVANVVEPGTFDLSDLDHMQSPGMSFFLQLPGPEDASGAFDKLLNAANNVAMELGGELRDEQLSVLTGQTREHMRQRIADFARRRLSKRA